MKRGRQWESLILFCGILCALLMGIAIASIVAHGGK